MCVHTTHYNCRYICMLSKPDLNNFTWELKACLFNFHTISVAYMRDVPSTTNCCSFKQKPKWTDSHNHSCFYSKIGLNEQFHHPAMPQSKWDTTASWFSVDGHYSPHCPIVTQNSNYNESRLSAMFHVCVWECNEKWRFVRWACIFSSVCPDNLHVLCAKKPLTTNIIINVDNQP